MKQRPEPIPERDAEASTGGAWSRVVDGLLGPAGPEGPPAAGGASR